MKTINKPNSATFARITKDGNGKYLAGIMQGQGFEQVYLNGRWFGTEAGAIRWINRQFA